jgi:hypothetical protein
MVSIIGWADLGATSRPKGLYKLKCQKISSGIESVTFHSVQGVDVPASWLNSLDYILAASFLSGQSEFPAIT